MEDEPARLPVHLRESHTNMQTHAKHTHTTHDRRTQSIHDSHNQQTNLCLFSLHFPYSINICFQSFWPQKMADWKPWFTIATCMSRHDSNGHHSPHVDRQTYSCIPPLRCWSRPRVKDQHKTSLLDHSRVTVLEHYTVEFNTAGQWHPTQLSTRQHRSVQYNNTSGYWRTAHNTT